MNEHLINNNNAQLSFAHQRPERLLGYIHINLNMIFYIHVEHSPNKTVYIKYFAKNKQNAPTSPRNTHTMTVAETGY